MEIARLVAPGSTVVGVDADEIKAGARSRAARVARRAKRRDLGRPPQGVTGVVAIAGPRWPSLARANAHSGDRILAGPDARHMRLLVRMVG